MNESLGFSHFFAHTDTVSQIILGLLLFASIVTWYLILSKSIHFFRMKRHSKRFLKIFWESPSLDIVAAEINRTGKTGPFSDLFHQGFIAVNHLSEPQETISLVDADTPDDMLTRALRRSIEESKSELEFGQTFLATVSSTAPFVGLLGTVWGIYHALVAIGLSGQSSLDKVAGPVGEALIMTGIGLAVAIPAAVAYNSFARLIRNTLTALNSFAYDVHNFLARGIKTSPSAQATQIINNKVVHLARAQNPSSQEGRKS